MEVPFSIPQCMARCGVVRQAGLSWPGRTSTRPGTVASVATGRLQPRGHQPAVSSPASTVLPCPQLRGQLEAGPRPRALLQVPDSTE